MLRRLLPVLAVGLLAAACDSFKSTAFDPPPIPVKRIELEWISGTAPAALPVGASVTFRASAFAPNDDRLDGRAVTWSVGDPAIVDLVPSQSGSEATVTGKKPGTTNVTVSIAKLEQVHPVKVIAGGAAQVVAISGSGQIGVAGLPLPQPLVAELRDASGNALGAGVSVTFTATSGTVPVSAPTNSQGRVSISWTPTSPGSQSLTAQTSATVKGTFTASVTTLALTAIVPSVVLVGTAVAPPPVVQLRLASDNSIFRHQGITVVASTPTPGVTLTSAQATTDVDGRATFTGLVVSGPLGPVTLRFAASSPSAFVDAPTTLNAGAPARLRIVTEPAAGAITNVTLSRQPVIQLADGSDNPVAQAGVVVSASLASGSSAGVTLTGGTATTGSDGKATFTNLRIVGSSGQTYRLTFTAPPSLSVTSTQTGTLTGAPATLFVTVPSSAQCGASLGSTVSARLRDAASRNVELAGTQVTLTPSAGATASVTSASTDATGVATFTGLVITGTPGSRTLTFSAAGLPSASGAVTVAAGAAAALTLASQPPGNATNGSPLSPTPVVQLVDGCGNAVSTAGIAIVATVTSGSVTFTNGTQTTASNGRATFTGLSMAGLTGSYTVRFTSTSLTPATAAGPTTLAAGPASTLTLITQPPTTAQHGVVLNAIPVVEVQDVGGNPVVGARSVTATVTSNGSNTLSNATATIGASSARATFTGLIINGTAGSTRLSFASSGLTGVTAASATVLGGAGTPATLALTTQQSSAALPGFALTTQPVVRLKDVNGGFAAAAGIVIEALGSAGTTSNRFATTDATGTATFANLSLSNAGSTQTIRFSTTGLADIISPTTTTVATSLNNGIGVTVSGAVGSTAYYGIFVPGTRLKVELSSGSGTADVYIRRGELPTPTQWDCSFATSQTQCDLTSVTPGAWFILVRGRTAFSGQVLKATLP